MWEGMLLLLLSSVALALVIYILVARVRKLEPELVLQPFL